MSKRVNKAHPFMPQTCRIQERDMHMRWRTMTYIKCNVCEGSVEKWSDENSGHCLDCGEEFQFEQKDRN